MFEDNVFDAFEFLNNYQANEENFTLPDKLNEGVDEAHKKQTSFLPSLSEQQTPGHARRQRYEIGVHKRENIVKGQMFSVDGNNLDVMDITTNRPLIKELERKGVLMKTIETIRADKECSEENIPSSLGYESQNLLDDALQDFKVGNCFQFLSYGGSSLKRDEEKAKSGFIQEPLGKQETTENRDIKTLGDSLAHFGLSSHLLKLETSLEDVRKNRKSKEDHEHCFKQIDKEIQKLSFKFHPDKVKNRGGQESEITKAQNLQSALNATRTALKLLNSAFIEDIGTDHNFGFYTKLSISSVCNEDEMKERIYEVIFKIGVISRIKQQNIISEIRKFLIESKSCVHSYLAGKFSDFEKARDLAFLHLKCCVKGYKKLCVELEEVRKQCKSDENVENMLSLLQSMASKSRRDLNLLKSLKRIVKSSLKGKYHFFSPEEAMDSYFVLPLVSYTNIILMCNVMVRKPSFFGILNNRNEADPYFNNDLDFMMYPHYLASYWSGNKYYERTVLRAMCKSHLIQEGFKLSKAEIELEFHTLVEQVNHYMDCKFIVEHYYEAPMTNLLALDLKKCLTLMTEFQEKEEEVSKGMQKFQKKTEEMDEKYEKFDKIMAAGEELNKKFKERLEQSKKLSEKVTSVLSEQLLTETD